MKILTFLQFSLTDNFWFGSVTQNFDRQDGAEVRENRTRSRRCNRRRDLIEPVREGEGEGVGRNREPEYASSCMSSRTGFAGTALRAKGEDELGLGQKTRNSLIGVLRVFCV